MKKDGSKEYGADAKSGFISECSATNFVNKESKTRLLRTPMIFSLYFKASMFRILTLQNSSFHVLDNERTYSKFDITNSYYSDLYYDFNLPMILVTNMVFYLSPIQVSL